MGEIDFYKGTHLGRAQSPSHPSLANNQHAINLQAEQKLNAYLLLARNGLERVVHGLSERRVIRTGSGFVYMNFHRCTQINLCILYDGTFVDISKLSSVTKNLKCLILYIENTFSNISN